MPDPVRLRILKAMTSALQEVTPANGYVNDLSAAVFRGRTLFSDDESLPLVAILEAPVPLEQQDVPEGTGVVRGTWELLVQGFVEEDPENPTDPAHLLLAEVKKRLGLEARKSSLPATALDGIFGMKRNVTEIRLGPGVVRPADEFSATAYFWLSVYLMVVEDAFDPYDEG